MPAGEPSALIRRTAPVTGSRRATEPPGRLAQTPPAPTATPAGEPSTGKARETRLVRGSTNSSCPLSGLVTQIPPSPAARPPGVLGRGMVTRGRPLAASILDSVLSVTLATHTDP